MTVQVEGQLETVEIRIDSDHTTRVDRVTIPLYFHPESWARHPNGSKIVFSCLGRKYGDLRWKLHGAYPDPDLPPSIADSKEMRSELRRQLRTALSEALRLEIPDFPYHLICGPWS